jgi:hypothetical protein
MTHEENVKLAIARAFRIFKLKGFSFRAMNRTRPVAKNTGYVEGHTSLQDKVVTIDIYTARLRKPKKISAILAVLAHEIAHHQKKPYRQRYRGRIITRWHYPQFYKQVTKNIAKLKKDKVLREFYN